MSDGQSESIEWGNVPDLCGLGPINEATFQEWVKARGVLSPATCDLGEGPLVGQTIAKLLGVHDDD